MIVAVTVLPLAMFAVMTTLTLKIAAERIDAAASIGGEDDGK